MSLVAGLRAFHSSDARQRRMALEAVAELVRARFVTLLPARIYCRDFGSIGGQGSAESASAGAAAAEVGRMVERVAAAMPFRALCLQQAIATSRMLRRRGVRPTVCLGLKPGDASAAAGLAAHAWVEVGTEIVSGAPGRAGCTVLARFG